ncbi:hypothetical protein [Streptomyces daghestanicus]|uniref:Uncharacterized protein n=1 Tax=Streptomyces daghestanicus TaxID=66885 RepID=A0ABQ3Q016_9ACTN|nr:hypothetical protein [Streptomyces daghestanicus]GGU64716.1 hypothetical protein GCM10010259_64060 [Streptomyces daghestanicus]GHI30610.1 hypothetical protein Sdagh_23400 [Streptomyces daghestanicus]
MSELTTVRSDTTEKPGLHVGWVMPPFFHEIPVDTDDAEEAAERLYETVHQVLPGGTDDDRLRMFVTYAAMLDELRGAGAVYAGFCLMDMDGRPSTANVAVYRMPLPDITTEDALPEALAALRRAYPADDVRLAALPCGRGESRAVVRIGDAPFELAAEGSPTGQPVTVPRGQIQVYVPLPNDAEMLAFELSTPSMEDWDFYSELFATIIRTLDWATEEEAEMAAALSQAQPVSATAPDPEAVQRLYAHSSRVLDVLAVRGRMDEGNAVSAVTCADCWAKGLTSACTARHQWQVDDVEDTLLAAAVTRLDEVLQAQGWLKLSGTPGQSVALAADGGTGTRVSATLLAGRRRLVVEVVAPCTRTVRATGDSVFG